MVASERSLSQKLLHVDICLVLGDRRLEQGRTVRPVDRLDRCGPGELLGRHPGKFRQSLERSGDAVFDLALAHPPGEPAASGTPARIEQLPVGIERAEQRGNGDHMRVARGSDELGGLALVRGPENTDASVRPRLGCQPVDQIAIVGNLTRGRAPSCVSRTTAASAASVGDDEREPGSGPQLANRMVTVLLGRRTRRPLLGPVVASGPERRTDTLASADPRNWEPDVDGQPYTVGDRHVEGLNRARRVDHRGSILPSSCRSPEAASAPARRQGRARVCGGGPSVHRSLRWVDSAASPCAYHDI